MSLAIILSVFTSFFVFSTIALAAPVDIWGGQYNAITGSIGLGSKDPRVTVANVINVLLGFLGIIAVVGIIIGGFLMMTSGGDESRSDTGKKAVTAGVIGLVIILASWSLATFIINNLWTATQ